jgi:PAS domain S-box-containing protein
MTDRVRLLVVDDEELDRDILVRQLEPLGYEVAVAVSAVDALEIIGRETFDLLLLDAQMPEMSGIEMLRVIRRSFSASQLPVIMVTSENDGDGIAEVLDLGASDYLSKPIDLPVALARIRAQTARRLAERALADSEERYALAGRGSKDGLWDWKVNTGEVFYSPRWNELLGFGTEASVSTLDRWLDRVHADDLDCVKAEMAAHISGDAAQFESEHRVRHQNGHLRWVVARGIAVRDNDGRAVRIAGSFTDVTESKVADAITGLPNRVLFMDRLARLIEHARREAGFRFALLFLDLDRFKNVNDSLGHEAGDRLLVHTAARLEQCVRATDTIVRLPGDPPAALEGPTVARMGGDEFAILLSGMQHANDAVRVAERIATALAEPLEIDGQDVYLSVSVGIALSATGYEQPVDMLRDADIALYQAKASGRACHAVFDRSMREQVVERLRLETDLRRALDRNEFVVYYQPIVSLTTGKIAGVEALLRWQHPDRGLVAPGEFIPLAEETGIIVPLGLWVFRDVCRQIQAWARLAPPPFTVAVNVSVRQLAQVDLPERLAEIAREYGVATSMLEIEITESAMMANPDETQALVCRLRSLGFRLSIDDFGTGYSSLAYLQRFTVDRLKIDRSFLAHDAGADSKDGIVQTIIGLAGHLNMEVVAEGVETLEQLTQLADLKCGFGQGYYFRTPGEADTIGRLLVSGGVTGPRLVAGSLGLVEGAVEPLRVRRRA